MRKVKIITDSTNDLSAELLQEYDIDVVPLHVDFGEETYRDGVDLIPARLFQLVEEKKLLPKTAAPTPYAYAECFRGCFDQEQDIIVITISAQMSSSYQNAVLAASEFPQGRIWIIDSQNLSTGIGALVITAAEYAQQGLQAEEVSVKIRDLVAKVHVSFVIDTLEYLYKGGRCNVLQNLMGSVLKIRPTIGVENGKMLVVDKVRGEKKKALDKLIENARRDSVDSKRIFITHSLGSEEEAIYLKYALQDIYPHKEILITNAGCVISSHCGQKTIGVIYIRK
ncbi:MULTISPECIES: DegV family protein [unclassified Dehalobacter]|uniref:DegV family protein n=1 Tax=unclassified Dehalobacter TaxID=2635733 RepID=UPI000E6B54E3|nr:MULTISPECIES: DegV family protein [unclassified Dehalobacter]RJE46950.1 fatty acid-binding protein DegV [Dehalobacter sp. MCB1]TCX50874.1 fatty acid-binding protein DegV [Dehalobacter sp. 12DCB1]TCX51586.1 fatty acid-binding protein DegV [Dehalobacter sp. 14DCB1]